MFTSSTFFFICLIPVLYFISRIWRNLKWGILLLVFLLPFERIPSWDIPIKWGITLRLSQVVGAILLVVFLCQLISQKISFKKLKKKLSHPAILSIGVYILIAFSSLAWALEVPRAGLIGLFTLFTILLGFLTFYLIENKGQLKKIEKVLFYSTLVVCLFGIWQFLADSFGLSQFWSGLRDYYIKEVMGFPRVQAMSLEPLYLANFLLIPLGLFSSLFLTKKSTLSSRSLGAILILIIANIVLTVSRGGYGAGIILLFLVIAFLFRKYSWNRLLKFLLLIIAGGVLAGTLVFFSSQIVYGDQSGTRQMLSHSRNMSDVQGSGLQTREGTWRWAFKAFKSNPIKGVGVGNFSSWLDSQGLKGKERTVNNQPLELLTETGIFGFLAVLSMIVFIIIDFIKAFKKKGDTYLKAYLAGLFSVFLAIWAQYMTFSTLYITHIWVLIGFLLAVSWIILKRDRRLQNGN